MKTRERDALRVKVGKLEKGLATLRDALKAIEEKVQELELQVAWDVNAIAHLTTLVKEHRSNCLC